ncbi:MAG: site-specific integrase [Desulfovibrio sp.]|nr:site-specific integrase [Desulfovibrio sp.]
MRKDGQTKKKWFIRYYDGERQYRYTIGEYPDMGLAEARNRALELRRRTVQGVSLAEMARQGKTGQTFGDFAESWIEKKKEGWVDGHTLRQRERLGTVIRIFGEKDVNDVSMDDVINAIAQKTQAGNYESARRTLSLIRQALEYADTLGRLADNRILVRIDSFRKTMSTPRRERHLYRELSEAGIGKLLADIEIESTKLKVETGAALKLAPYLIVRPKELCGARWEEIDLEKAEWVLPAERMKMGREHVVPLPTQAVEILGELEKLTGNGEYVFPSYGQAKPHIGTEALIRAFRRMGYTSYRKTDGIFFTTHGFRGMASAILYQKLQYPGHLIGLQLAHVDENKVRAAYNRIHSRSWLDERRVMLQAYADYLDGLKEKETE